MHSPQHLPEEGVIISLALGLRNPGLQQELIEFSKFNHMAVCDKSQMHTMVYPDPELGFSSLISPNETAKRFHN